jgi:cyclic lactone autoinducer peptide
MNKKWVKGIQNILMAIAILAVGRSVPWTMYERELPKEVLKRAGK